MSHDAYNTIISVDNLLAAWKEFLSGKRKKTDVQQFQYCLLDNILEVQDELKKKMYKHGDYYAFKINDPKTFVSGVDFLGWVHFPTHRVLRTATKKRMLRNIEMKKVKSNAEKLEATIQSYRGMLSHGNGYKLAMIISEIHGSA